MTSDERNAEEARPREGGGTSSVPKLTKYEKRSLPAGTEWEIEMESNDSSGHLRTFKCLEWRLSTEDSHISFQHVDMGRGAPIVSLQSRRKGPVVDGIRQDRVQVIVIFEGGRIQRYPEQTVEVRVGSSEEVSPEEAANQFNQFHSLFKGAFAEFRANVGREFPSKEHLEEDIQQVRNYVQKNLPKKGT